MILALVCVPLVAGLIAFGWRSDAGRRMLLVLSALVHLGLTAACWVRLPAPMWDGWLKLDSLGLLFLSIASVLFLASSIYCLGYLGKEHDVSHIDFEEHLFFSNEPEAVFTGCLLLFLASMTLGHGEPAFRPAVGRHRSHNAGQRAVDLLPSATPFAGSHLEISADLLRGHRSGAVGKLPAGRCRGRGRNQQLLAGAVRFVGSENRARLLA